MSEEIYDQDMGNTRKMLQEKYELYETPDEPIIKLWERISPYDKTILEPACNAAPFCRIAKTYGARMTTGIDIRDVSNDSWSDRFVQCDFPDWESNDPFDICVFNPPFSKTIEFIHAAQKLVKPGGLVICLQRLDILGGINRNPFWNEGFLKELIVLSKRFSFTNDNKTDRYNYGFYVFSPNASIQTTLDWVL